MNKEIYEKHIGELEQRIEWLENSLKVSKEKNRTLLYENMTNKEKSVHGLIKFLNSMHTQVGGIQVDILNQLTSLNMYAAEISGERVGEATRILKALLPQDLEAQHD